MVARGESTATVYFSGPGLWKIYFAMYPDIDFLPKTARLDLHVISGPSICVMPVRGANHPVAFAQQTH